MRQILGYLYTRRTLLVRHFLQFILGFTAGRASLGGLTPFSSSFAVASTVVFGNQAWSVVAGIILGITTRWEAASFLQGLASTLAVIAAVLLVRRIEGLMRNSCVPGVLVAGGANFIVKGIFFLFLEVNPKIFLGLLSESVLVALFTILFIFGMGETWCRKELRICLFFMLVLCGLGDIVIGPVTFREVLVREILLVTAFFWGPGGGAGAGVLLGLLAAGDPWSILPKTGFYAGTGFFAGIPSGLGRCGTILGFFLASLFFSLFYGELWALYGHLAAAFLAVLVFYFSLPFIEQWFGWGKKTLRQGYPLQVEVGFSQCAKLAEPLCGDSFIITRLAPHRLLLAVSDGMGSGINAARESRIVVKMLEQLLGNGVSLEAAVGIVNTALYLRGKEEIAATIDLALVNLEEKFLDFLKAGAAPSFLKRGKNVEMIRTSCWPVGILEQVEVQVLRSQVLPGDLLIMATDGVTEIDEKALTPGAWLYNYLKELPLEEPQVIADLILKSALRVGGSCTRDDMTVLVARFCTYGELE